MTAPAARGLRNARHGWAAIFLIGLGLTVLPTRLSGQAPSHLAAGTMAPAAMRSAQAGAGRAAAGPVCNRRSRWIQAWAVIVGAMTANIIISHHLRREAPCDNCLAEPMAAGLPRRTAAVGTSGAAAAVPGAAGANAAAVAVVAGPTTAAIEVDPAVTPSGAGCMSNRRFWTITGVAIAAGTILNIVLSHKFRKQ